MFKQFQFINWRQGGKPALLKGMVFLVVGGFLLGGLVGVVGATDGPVFIGGGIAKGIEDIKPEVNKAGITTDATLTQMILYWVKIAIMLMGTMAFVAFVYAGILYVTSFTNEENAEKGKKIMIYAIVGIIIVLFSYTIVNFFLSYA